MGWDKLNTPSPRSSASDVVEDLEGTGVDTPDVVSSTSDGPLDNEEEEFKKYKGSS